MNTQTISIQSPDRDLRAERGARRSRVRRGPAVALARRADAAEAARAVSPDRPEAARQAGGVGGARILRRWSVADLIARAGGAPRTFA
jgi:hypothetical protein